MTTVAMDTEKWVPELTFGARLALVRHRMGWNVKEAAAACGLPAQSWRGWEVAGHLPRRYVEIAKVISTRTGVEYHWLVFGPDGGEGGVEPNRRLRPLAERVIERTGTSTRPKIRVDRVPTRPASPVHPTRRRPAATRPADRLEPVNA